MTYSIGPSFEDYEEWLAARAEGVTASEVGKLAHSGSASWMKLKAEKAGLTEPWKGNQYSRWGQEREPAIAAIIAEKYSWLKPNDNVLRLDDDPRLMATPDMMGDAGLCQIKTHLWKGEPLTAPVPSHETQCQFELLVTGADENILVYEYYEPTPHGFQVRDPFAPLQEFLIVRDEERIEQLRGIAYQFLAMGEPSPMDALIADWADAKIAADVAKDRLAEVEEKIRHEIGPQDSFKHVSEVGSVTLTTPKPTERFDSTRFKKENEDTYREYVTTSQGKPRLTVRAA